MLPASANVFMTQDTRSLRDRKGKTALQAPWCQMRGGIAQAMP